jgi:hypothetical protein
LPRHEVHGSEHTPLALLTPATSSLRSTNRRAASVADEVDDDNADVQSIVEDEDDEDGDEDDGEDEEHLAPKGCRGRVLVEGQCAFSSAIMIRITGSVPRRRLNVSSQI